MLRSALAGTRLAGDKFNDILLRLSTACPEVKSGSVFGQRLFTISFRSASGTCWPVLPGYPQSIHTPARATAHRFVPAIAALGVPGRALGAQAAGGGGRATAGPDAQAGLQEEQTTYLVTFGFGHDFGLSTSESFQSPANFGAYSELFIRTIYPIG
ncbi:MAG: hypothetical protein KGL39_54370 [Patescibacteria group bacterium]|nr:hypothetical protein [Patescibacteria group bacterium]